RDRVTRRQSVVSGGGSGGRRDPATGDGARSDAAKGTGAGAAGSASIRRSAGAGMALVAVVVSRLPQGDSRRQPAPCAPGRQQQARAPMAQQAAGRRTAAIAVEAAGIRRRIAAISPRRNRCEFTAATLARPSGDAEVGVVLVV